VVVFYELTFLHQFKFWRWKSTRKTSKKWFDQKRKREPAQILQVDEQIFRTFSWNSSRTESKSY